MNAFRLRLAKVLEWRRSELALAETRSRRQTAAIAALGRTRAARDAIRAEMARGRAPRRPGRVARRRNGSSTRFRLRCWAARRRFRLLERLRDRRFAEWQEAVDRELDQLASDSHLARLARRGTA